MTETDVGATQDLVIRDEGRSSSFTLYNRLEILAIFSLENGLRRTLYLSTPDCFRSTRTTHGHPDPPIGVF